MIECDDVSELFDFARAWSDLGASTQQQILEIVDDPNTDEANPNLIRKARELLEGYNIDLDCALSDYLRRHKK